MGNALSLRNNAVSASAVEKSSTPGSLTSLLPLDVWRLVLAHLSRTILSRYIAFLAKSLVSARKVPDQDQVFRFSFPSPKRLFSVLPTLGLVARGATAVWAAAPVPVAFPAELQRHELLAFAAIPSLSSKLQTADLLRRWDSMETVLGRNEPDTRLNSAFKSFLGHSRTLTHLYLAAPLKASVLNVLATNGCPLVEVGLVSKLKDFFSGVNEESWALLRPSLRHLHLFSSCDQKGCVDIPNCAPTSFLASIAKHLGETLQTLCICANDWSPLKTMKVLTHLDIRVTKDKLELVDHRELAKSVAGQVLANPPCLGPNLSLRRNSSPKYSLLLDLVRNNHVASVKELVQKHHGDPNAWFYDFSDIHDRFSLLTRDMSLELFKFLINSGGDPSRVFYQSSQPTNLFALALQLDWNKRWEWLFDTQWEKYKATCPLPQGSALFAALAKAESTLPDLLKFLKARPHILGDQVWGVDEKGCNLAHYVRLILDPPKKFNINPYHRDRRGNDGFECRAARLDPKIIPEFLAEDAEFAKRYLTPLVSGSFTFDYAEDRRYGTSTQDNFIEQLTAIGTPVSLEVSEAMFQIQLRLGPVHYQPVASAFNVWGNVSLPSLFVTLKEVSQRPWYRRYALTPEQARLPLLHHLLLNRDSHLWITVRAEDYFTTKFHSSKAKAKERRTEWVSEVDDMGRNAVQHAKFYAFEYHLDAKAIAAIEKVYTNLLNLPVKSE